MKVAPRTVYRLRQALAWLVPVGFVIGVFLVYRWAGGTSGEAPRAYVAPAAHATLRLSETPFVNYVAGRKSWSLWAKQIDLERLPGATFANIQNASLTDIRVGKLYAEPDGKSRVVPTDGAEISMVRDTEKPIATFHARSGLYTLGQSDSIPPELNLTYQVSWQFKLMGGVDFRTREGDRLQTESLAIIELVNRKTGRPLRRIFCDAGAQVTYGTAKLIANRVRFDPSDRTVECLEGVRGVYRDGSLQTERLFWQLKPQLIHCPDLTSGASQGTPYTADNLTIDLGRRRLTASRMGLEMPADRALDVRSR